MKQKKIKTLNKFRARKRRRERRRKKNRKIKHFFCCVFFFVVLFFWPRLHIHRSTQTNKDLYFNFFFFKSGLIVMGYRLLF